MVPLCLAARSLAAHQARTQASRDVLSNATGRDTQHQAMSRASAANLAFSPCCASGTCTTGGGFTPAGLSAGVCLPVRSAIDDALAGVESVVAKTTCWAAPICLPTDDGKTDIAPLLGAGGRNVAATDAFRHRLAHVFHGNEHRLYLSSEYCNNNEDTISALQDAARSSARGSCIDLKVQKRTKLGHCYIEVQREKKGGPLRGCVLHA